MNDQALAAHIKKVACRLDLRGPLPPVARMVSTTEMVAASADPARPAGAKIWVSGELWWDEANPVTESGLTHELTHWLLMTSPVGHLYPHSDSDTDGHGALFAGLAWALMGRVGTVPDHQHQQYDPGRVSKPGDRPADRREERWARRWARRPHEGTAEALAVRAIRDYRLLCQRRALVAAIVPLVRLLAALAAAMAAPALLARMIS
ncbi:hypothetical protein [Acidiferrobacter sp.]|uniref:hypothetical protein n=1 Tax=Acidiferrobacter sp. TaxID=1872107 RepID=UPI00262B8CD9|nr:hypothetical protein [Acidiferrobacter sp.]